MAERRPAFQCYASDDVLANGEVAELSHEAFGLFFRLYCRAWLEEGLPDDAARLARWARLDPARFDALWSEMSHLWTKGEDGRLRNDAQEAKRAKVSAYSASRSENGAKGGRPRKAHENHMVSDEKHMKSKTKAKKSSPSPIPSPTLKDSPSEGAPAAPDNGNGSSGEEKANRLVSWFIDHRRKAGMSDLSPAEIGQMAGIAKTICERYPAERINLARRGIVLIFPYAPPPAGRGEPWTLKDLLNRFTDACTAAERPAEPARNGKGDSGGVFYEPGPERF